MDKPGEWLATPEVDSEWTTDPAPPSADSPWKAVSTAIGVVLALAVFGAFLALRSSHVTQPPSGPSISITSHPATGSEGSTRTGV